MHVDLVKRRGERSARGGAEPSDSPIMAVRGLEVEYPGSRAPVHAVRGVSFDLWEGEAVGLVGESGCGKSTLGRSLIGLQGFAGGRLVAGKITIDGMEFGADSGNEWDSIRGNPVAMVFQDPMTYLNPLMTCGKQIAEAVAIHQKGAKIKDVVSGLLERVHLQQSTANRYPHELSGGMRQRVVIAIALACRPRLLIADEPTTALDVTTQARILDLLHELRTDLGMTVLLVTHDLAVVSQFCSRTIVMYAGEIVEEGATETVLAAPRHPYTKALVSASERRRTSSGDFATIGGEVPNLMTEMIECGFRSRCPVSFDRCVERPPLFQLPATGESVRCWRAEDVDERK